MTTLARYKKALAGLLVGVATAVLLLPSDAPGWLLALIPVANLIVVALAPRNAPPPTGVISPAPTSYRRPRPPDDPLPR